MSKIFYKQCKLEKGCSVLYTWLPEKYCKIRKYLKLKTDDVWIDGWMVANVFDPRMSEEVINAVQNYYKSHTKGSDI